MTEPRKSPARARRNRRSAPAAPTLDTSTRERLLDAAEVLFSRMGYYGASIRQIAREADTEFSLCQYYFGSKDDLFRAVIERRAIVICRELSESLDEALEGPRPLTPETVISAFIKPAIAHWQSNSPGWIHYLELVVHLSSVKHRPELRTTLDVHYQPAFARYVDALMQAAPSMDRRTSMLALHFVTAVLDKTLVDLNLTDRLTGGAVTLPYDQSIHDAMVAFLAAGVRRLAEQAKRGKTRSNGAQDAPRRRTSSL